MTYDELYQRVIVEPGTAVDIAQKFNIKEHEVIAIRAEERVRIKIGRPRNES